MQQDLSSATGPDKMSASTARKKKEPVGLVLFVKNHGGSKKPAMTGL